MSAILLVVMSTRASTIALAKVSTPVMHCIVSFVLLSVVTGVNQRCRPQGQWDVSPALASTVTWDARGHHQWDGFPTSPPPPSTFPPQPAHDEVYCALGNEPKNRPFATSVPYTRVLLTRPASLAVVSNNHRAILLLRTACSLVHLGHASCETLSGLLSLDAGRQVVAWPKTPHVVNQYPAHTTSSRRTQLIQELANIPAVAFAATIHDMIFATSGTSHHTWQACAHAPVVCTLYAVGRPTPPGQRINPLLMCHQVVSQLQAIAWPTTPHGVNGYLGHATSPRRTELVQELASIPAVTFAATTHDMTSATCVTLHHT